MSILKKLQKGLDDYKTRKNEEETVIRDAGDISIQLKASNKLYKDFCYGAEGMVWLCPDLFEKHPKEIREDRLLSRYCEHLLKQETELKNKIYFGILKDITALNSKYSKPSGPPSKVGIRDLILDAGYRDTYGDIVSFFFWADNRASYPETKKRLRKHDVNIRKAIIEVIDGLEHVADQQVAPERKDLLIRYCIRNLFVDDPVDKIAPREFLNSVQPTDTKSLMSTGQTLISGDMYSLRNQKTPLKVYLDKNDTDRAEEIKRIKKEDISKFVDGLNECFDYLSGGNFGLDWNGVIEEKRQALGNGFTLECGFPMFLGVSGTYDGWGHFTLRPEYLFYTNKVAMELIMWSFLRELKGNRKDIYVSTSEKSILEKSTSSIVLGLTKEEADFLGWPEVSPISVQTSESPHGPSRDDLFRKDLVGYMERHGIGD